ncbi:BnaC09g53900D [Brassica napus]|uniref:BnaC09g53900D protein n=1 Tax=Brassica napus TaxID=3708 RepID=A0A078JIN2_BRANA|nr:BnaC09g53900D [Brassica napus]
MNNLKKKGKLLSIAKGCEVEVSLKEDGFKGSWFRAILEQNLTRVKGEKLQVCYKTFLNEDGVNPYKETIERCFIRPVPLECLNEGVVFKEGSVVDAYFSDGWWTVVIAVERQMVLNQHMFRKGKLVKMTRKISESKVIWVRALVITEIQYSLNDFVEVFVTHGLRKARVMEILIDNHYKVYFEATKENAVFNYTEIRLSMEWLSGGSWILAHKREFENNAATPIRSAQESHRSIPLPHESDDMVNDDATEITSSRESHGNTSGKELPLPHESEDMMDDVATPIIDPREIPRGKM